MDTFLFLFTLLVYQPLLNALVSIYTLLPTKDLGIAIILLTALIRLIFYPLNSQGIKAQLRLSLLQPKLKEIQEKFKQNKEELAKATLELYKKEKINPLSGILPLLVQIPLLIGLYKLFLDFGNGQQEAQLKLLYPFIASPESMNPLFLGILNLKERFLPLALGTALLQFLQAKIMPSPAPKRQPKEKPDVQALIHKQTLFILPAFTLLILSALPSAISLYWATTTALAIIQQILVTSREAKKS